MKKGLNCHLFLVVIFGCRECWSDDDVTLTTARIREDTSPMPTSIYRRIQVDPILQSTNRPPLDLFSLRAHELRRTRQSNIWNWDFWCQLQAKTGNGTKKINRYYYNTQIDQCLPFIYSGSNGNKNRFDTVGDCERYCKGAAYMSIDDQTRSSCSLQPHAGLCMAMFYKYYYDVNEGRCKDFMYGGCGGNQNQFSSIVECMRRCSPNHTKLVDHY